MTATTVEIWLMWGAVTLYAVGAVLFVVALLFPRPALRAAALTVSLAGLAPHVAAIAVRWVTVGHGPYLGFYEVVSSFAFVTVLVFGLVLARYRSLAPVGVLIMPIAFLLLGGSMLAPKTGLEVTGKLASWWLLIHVSFAKLSYGAFIASFALALIYLMREAWSKGAVGEVLAKLPAQDVIDDLSFRFVAVGFIFLGIMIAAGAIWANEAWGRYWAWDPIETWSLISWVVYALYLHLRLTMGWRGRKAAWVCVVALPVVLFALIGVPIAYNSIHGAYLKGF